MVRPEYLAEQSQRPGGESGQVRSSTGYTLCPYPLLEEAALDKAWFTPESTRVCMRTCLCDAGNGTQSPLHSRQMVTTELIRVLLVRGWSCWYVHVRSYVFLYHLHP